MKIERIDVTEPGITIIFSGEPLSCERKEIMANLCVIVEAGYPNGRRIESESSEHETVFALPKGVRLWVVTDYFFGNPDFTEMVAVYEERIIDGVRRTWCVKSVYPTASGTIVTLNQAQYEQILKSVWRRTKDLKVVWESVPDEHADIGRHGMRHGGNNLETNRQADRETPYA